MSISGLQSIHIAAQYLAAAGISYVQKRDDDSHTNVGYSAEEQLYFTWPLNKAGDYLALNLAKFSIDWISPDETSSLLLDRRSHREVVSWISEIAKQKGLSVPYRYELHYTLPYDIPEDFQFQKDSAALEREILVRTLAQRVLSTVLKEYNLKSDIRTWPHHFDIGAFSGLPGREEISLGLGLALPDTLIDDYYFYISGYKGHDTVDTSSFMPLGKGQWLQKGFQGAILRADKLEENTAREFFSAAIQAYRV